MATVSCYVPQLAWHRNRLRRWWHAIATWKTYQEYRRESRYVGNEHTDANNQSKLKAVNGQAYQLLIRCTLGVQYNP
jgi:hypothetical protein